MTCEYRVTRTRTMHKESPHRSDTIAITERGCDAITFYPRDLDSLIVPV